MICIRQLTNEGNPRSILNHGVHDILVRYTGLRGDVGRDVGFYYQGIRQSGFKKKKKGRRTEQCQQVASHVGLTIFLALGDFPLLFLNQVACNAPDDGLASADRPEGTIRL